MFLLIILGHFDSFCQSSNAAINLFHNAELSFEKQNYNSSIKYLYSCKSNLNNQTNPKIQSLLVLNYINLNDNINAKIEIDRYFKVVNPSYTNIDGYKEMVTLRQEINTKVNSIIKARDRKRSKNAERIKEAKQAEFNKLLAARKEENSKKYFFKVKDQNTIEGYNAFVTTFPESSYCKSARNGIDEIHWTNAESANTIPAYKEYLILHPYALHKVAAENIIDNHDWKEAISKNTVFAFEHYYKIHPKGLFISQAKTNIDTHYWNLARKYDNIKYYNMYITNCPFGIYYNLARSRMNSYQSMKDDPNYELSKAIDDNNLLAVKRCIVYGANVNKRNYLHICADKGYPEVAKVLIDKGAYINNQDDFKMTPLHIAVHEGHYAMCVLLIEAGANQNIRDKWERKPIHIARKKKYKSIIKLLKL